MEGDSSEKNCTLDKTFVVSLLFSMKSNPKSSLAFVSSFAVSRLVSVKIVYVVCSVFTNTSLNTPVSSNTAIVRSLSLFN